MKTPSPTDVKAIAAYHMIEKAKEMLHEPAEPCSRAAQCSASGVEAEVCADIAARQRRGIEKYGTTVADNPLSLEQWLQHAYEECLDQAIYLKKAIAVTKTQNGRDQRPGAKT